MTVGLPGSGKTTWAEEFKAENPNTVIVCKDDIRAEMGVVVGDESTRVKESKVIGKRDEKIMNALKRGLNVIVADTNFNHLHKKQVKSLIFPKYRGIYEFEIKDFTDVPVETCIERCANRPEGREFWKKVIMSMKNEFLPPKKLYEARGYYDSDHLPKCVIFDLDGTLALMSDRSPFDDARCFEDYPNAPMVDVARMFGARDDVTVICLSGRDEGRARKPTENWLVAHGVDFDHLYMRKAGDSRKDSIIKRELFDEHIRGKYLVYAVFDDRPQVCRDLWTVEGLPLFQFGNAYHEF